MSKMLKKVMAKEYDEVFKDVDSFIVFGYESLPAKEAHNLRVALGEQGICVKVVKNNIAGVALAKYFPEKVRELFKGPTALAYKGESIVGVAKGLIDWNKTAKKLEIRGGYLPGSVLAAADVDELSKIPPKEVLLSILAASFEGPLKQIATIMERPLQDIGNAVNALIEKMEEKSAETAGDVIS